MHNDINGSTTTSTTTTTTNNNTTNYNTACLMGLTRSGSYFEGVTSPSTQATPQSVSCQFVKWLQY